MDFGALIRKLQGDKSADVLPWINVGNAGKQLITGKDYDVLPGISTGDKGRPGQVHLSAVPDFGVRSTSFNPTGREDNFTPRDETIDPPTDNVGGNLTYDPAYQAFLQEQARQAADAAEAQRIRDAILGRRKSVEDLLNDILDNIDTQLREGKGSREAQFTRDVADLVAALDGSLPDIENAFAALGLSNSTYKADRIQDTRDSYERSYVDTERQKEEDLTAMQQKAKAEKAKWQGEANNILDTISTFKDLQPTHNDLNRLRDADLSSKKAINSFRSSRDAFQPGSEALSAITKLDGDYDFSKTLESFNSLASENNPASGSVSAQAAGSGRLFEDDKKNKKKTEVQVNNPVGAASA